MIIEYPDGTKEHKILTTHNVTGYAAKSITLTKSDAERLLIYKNGFPEDKFNAFLMQLLGRLARPNSQ